MSKIHYTTAYLAWLIEEVLGELVSKVPLHIGHIHRDTSNFRVLNRHSLHRIFEYEAAALELSNLCRSLSKGAACVDNHSAAAMRPWWACQILVALLLCCNNAACVVCAVNYQRPEVLSYRVVYVPSASEALQRRKQQPSGTHHSVYVAQTELRPAQTDGGSICELLRHTWVGVWWEDTTRSCQIPLLSSTACGRVTSTRSYK